MLSTKSLKKSKVKMPRMMLANPRTKVKPLKKVEINVFSRPCEEFQLTSTDILIFSQGFSKVEASTST